jgi:hypothetical protein
MYHYHLSGGMETLLYGLCRKRSYFFAGDVNGEQLSQCMALFLQQETD